MDEFYSPENIIDKQSIKFHSVDFHYITLHLDELMKHKQTIKQRITNTFKNLKGRLTGRLTSTSKGGRRKRK